eukprot:gb/GECG01012345.1/.p1 GENE.gb/GECG01012345.1/~~gb/GECG01012345.1/.p1  ORF type:complete len:173 (+),score=11.74 gb/GECG01012345.1/:1-519(+)
MLAQPFWREKEADAFVCCCCTIEQRVLALSTTTCRKKDGRVKNIEETFALGSIVAAASGELKATDVESSRTYHVRPTLEIPINLVLPVLKGVIIRQREVNTVCVCGIGNQVSPVKGNWQVDRLRGTVVGPPERRSWRLCRLALQSGTGPREDDVCEVTRERSEYSPGGKSEP